MCRCHGEWRRLSEVKESQSDFEVCEEGALFFGRERVAVHFEDAAGERLKLLGRDFDHTPDFAPLDNREAPGFVSKDDIGLGAAHGAQGAAGLFVGNEDAGSVQR